MHKKTTFLGILDEFEQFWVFDINFFWDFMQNMYGQLCMDMRRELKGLTLGVGGKG